MQNIKSLFKKYIGELTILIGAFISTYNLFNFKSSYYDGCPGLKLFDFGFRSGSDKCLGISTYYFYKDSTLILLGVGIVLFILGILIMKSKNKI